MHSIELDGLGWIEWDSKHVRVGDEWLPEELLVTFPGAPDQPVLTLRLAIVDGVPLCRSVTLESKPDSRNGVRWCDLRLVTLEDWTVDLYAVAASYIGDVDETGEFVLRRRASSDDELRAANKSIRRARAGGRRVMTAEKLEEVARIYREHANERPVEAVAAAFGRKYRTAAGYVEQARAAGLLPPTTPGKVTI